jgi:hypothetical protein
MRYHGRLANAAKILTGMRENPRDWRIEDLKVVAAGFGIVTRQHGTSHVVFYRPGMGSLLSVPARRPIKPV